MTTSLRRRHLTLAALALLLAGLAAAGCIGPAGGRERITAYDVTATIRADGTVAVREVIDWDFGSAARRGIFRLIPSDGGVPAEIDVSAPEAPDQFTVRTVGTETEVRIGDPDQTNRGRYRYQITYVLPRTIVDDRFALDAVGTRFDVPIEAARVTVVGAELTDRGCFTGAAGSIEQCDLVEVADGYRTEVDDLPTGEGVTVDGDVVRIVEAADPAVPPFQGRSGHPRLTWAGIVGGLAVLVALVVFVACRQLGRNQVAAGGATEAAFAGGSGPLAFGPHPRDAAVGSPHPPASPTEMVADQRMGELAGLEFVPPEGVEPWQAAVVLRERIDDRTVGAWFAGLAAHDIVTMDRPDGKVVLEPGPRAAEADPSTAAVLNQAFSGRRRLVLGHYDSRFATAWAQVGTTLTVWAQTSGTFRRRPPRHRGGRSLFVPTLFALIMATVVLGNLAATGVLGSLRSAPAAIVVTLAVMGPAAWMAYRRLARSLSVTGSAIALRTESFRRFLHASEAAQVDWAWQNGLLREYSAWAVALGEAQAWNAAMAASSVPQVERASSAGVMSPSLFDSAFLTTRTEPASTGSGSSSSGSSSGSSFSGGGSVGGGGGGGGGGSW